MSVRLLLTLGQLKVDGLDFRREKPLLLVYPSLCGPQSRRSVARQFWPGRPIRSTASRWWFPAAGRRGRVAERPVHSGGGDDRTGRKHRRGDGRDSEARRAARTGADLLNTGWLLERQEQPEAALDFYLRATVRAGSLRQSATAARAWNNVGVIRQTLGQDPEATQAYQTAIGHARLTGETRVLAMVLGNLAELQESLPLIDEAIALLHGIGQDDLAAYFETQREVFRGRSGVGA